MKSSLFALTTMVAVAFASVGFAADLKVGVVNFQKVISESKVAQAAAKELQKKNEAFQSELRDKEKPLVDKRAELAEQQSVMEAEKFKAEQTEFITDVRELQTEMTKKRKELDKTVFDKNNEVLGAIKKIVDNYAEAQGITLLVPSTGVVYTDEAFDITDAVIKEVNKKLK